MDVETIVDERVVVIAIYPIDQGERRNCVPMRMYYKNEWHKFTELCFRHPTIKGQRTIHVFDMTSETQHYRLELNTETNVWFLKTMGYGKYVS